MRPGRPCRDTVGRLIDPTCEPLIRSRDGRGSMPRPLQRRDLRAGSSHPGVQLWRVAAGVAIGSGAGAASVGRHTPSSRRGRDDQRAAQYG